MKASVISSHLAPGALGMASMMDGANLRTITRKKLVKMHFEKRKRGMNCEKRHIYSI